MRFVLDLLLGRETRQRGYVLRTLLAAFGYLLGVVIAEVALSIGVADLGPARVFQGAALTAGLISYGMVRWGWTRNFRDPAMTMTQMLVGQTMAVVAYVLLHEFRGALIGLSVAVASFGTFSLTRDRQWAMSLYALLTMGAGMLWMSVRDPMNFPPEVEAVHFLILMILQSMAALLGAQFGEMRRRLRNRKRELEVALDRIQELANRDSLTGLYNRRYAQELIDHHVHLKDRNGRPLAMALIDLDHFKQVNDQYGHAVGDRVLQTFAQQARQATRDADIVARWGGEEFLIVMPETSADGAALLVERLREALSAVAVSDAVPALRIAFSAGITAHRAGEHTDQTVQRADEALYEAKRAGRDRVVVDATGVPAVGAEIGLSAMERGKHVYVEKPASVTVEEGRAMVKAARTALSEMQTVESKADVAQALHALHARGVERVNPRTLEQVIAFATPAGASDPASVAQVVW